MYPLLRTIPIILLLMGSPFLSAGQVSDSLPDLFLQNEELMEGYAEVVDGEFDFSQLTEELGQLSENPVQINSRDSVELSRQELLNEQQVKNLLFYTTEYGPIASIYELQLIEGFNQQFIQQIAPYITLTLKKQEVFRWKESWKHARIKASLRYQRILQQQAGYGSINDSVLGSTPNNHYLGSADAICFRVAGNNRERVKWGLVTEKDAGEPFLRKQDSIHRGFDFNSGYLSFKEIGPFRQLVLGDYHLQFGQGLTLSNGISFGTAPGMLPSRKRGEHIRPSLSTNEGNYFRGIATSYTINRLGLNAFVSLCRRDASETENDTLSDEGPSLNSILESGYHRTIPEIESRHRVREKLLGAHLAYNGKRFRAGITAYHLQYDHNFVMRKEVYRKFQDAGNATFLIGCDWSYAYKRLILYGESSCKTWTGFAHLAGLNFSPDPRLSLSMVFRWYGLSYTNRYSAAFGKSSENNNEYGLYVGLLSSVTKQIRLTLQLDIFRYPWLRYRIDAPSNGNEFSVCADYLLSRKGSMRISFKHSDKPTNLEYCPELTHSVGLRSVSQWQWRFQYQVSPWVLILNRVDFQLVRKSGTGVEKGLYISQDAGIGPEGKTWRMHVRYALFDTESYDARIFAYENDLPSSFSIPAFNGKGARYFILLRGKFGKNLEGWLRYSSTILPGTEYISEGPNQISGPVKSEVKAMIIYKLSY